MKRTLEVTGPAWRDFRAVIGYIARESPQAASLTVLRMEKTLQLLLDFPGLGALVLRPPGTRKIRVRRTRLYFVYEIDGQIIRVLRILHEAQNWPEG